jgi:hypothetical protein
VLNSNLPASFSSLRTLERHATNLPTQLTPLIGLEANIAAVLTSSCAPTPAL